MKTYSQWKYDEYQQVGKDYSLPEEVEVYDSSHAQFRDIAAENAALVEKLDLTPAKSLLDLGAGTGEFALAAAEVCGFVLGIDVSPAMINAANEKLRLSNVANLEFHHAGYLDFNVTEESFDVATSSFSLHHLPDYWKGEALQRVNRSLKAGGVFFLRDVVLPDEDAPEFVSKFVEKQERLGGAFLREDAIGHFKEEFSTYEWVMRGLLERSGFAIEDTKTSDGLVVEYLCWK